MKTLCKYAQKYKDEMSVADMALLKVCLCSAGILWGLAIPRKHKKKTAAWASIFFVFSYAPLITKLLRIVSDDPEKKLL
ncbi:permease of phosphate ABC transporter [Sinanaerobacter chloroacetimidivorans]|uniref:Permease of phosphate ABC transporter n=1 Tax=Sinanaerobacter chloroacetimidivorans TaxID=2818044 RepID=A0A8J7W291_9FIRM|nr:permease of phosphate ABC transporter [Sinanaerobacter chloroacetimidivorans]MBR0599549.1 permease of phosphate ABC transporter [Sinanaerobacter chloroacetimidivorans]